MTPRLDADTARLYDRLRRSARHLLHGERSDHTLDSSALVAEAFARMRRRPDLAWDSDAHFLAIAVKTIRDVLVDHARARLAERRGSGAVRVPLSRAVGLHVDSPERVILLSDTLDRLGALDAQALAVAEARIFGGLTLAETAASAGLSVATARRRWAFAKVWLQREMGANPDSDTPAPRGRA